MFEPKYSILTQHIDINHDGEQYSQIRALNHFFYSKRAAIGFALRNAFVDESAILFQIGEFVPTLEDSSKKAIHLEGVYHSIGRVLSREQAYIESTDYEMLNFIQNQPSQFFLQLNLSRQKTIRALTEHDIVYNQKLQQIWPRIR